MRSRLEKIFIFSILIAVRLIEQEKCKNAGKIVKSRAFYSSRKAKEKLTVILTKSTGTYNFGNREARSGVVSTYV